MQNNGSLCEKRIVIGNDCFIDVVSPHYPNAVVFEDDGETGFFYILDRSKSENQIIDAIHIYDVLRLRKEGTEEAVVKIAWSDDGMRACLYLDDWLQAEYDYTLGKGRSRSGFPPGHERLS